MLYIHNMLVPICPKQPFISHSTAASIKEKKSKTPSSFQPVLHQLSSEYAMSLLSFSPPFMMSWWEAQCTLLKWIFSNQGAAWPESSCQQEMTERPGGDMWLTGDGDRYGPGGERYHRPNLEPDSSSFQLACYGSRPPEDQKHICKPNRTLLWIN